MCKSTETVIDYHLCNIHNVMDLKLKDKTVNQSIRQLYDIQYVHMFACLFNTVNHQDTRQILECSLKSGLLSQYYIALNVQGLAHLFGTPITL